MHKIEGDVKTMPAPNYIPLEVNTIFIHTKDAKWIFVGKKVDPKLDYF